MVQEPRSRDYWNVGQRVPRRSANVKRGPCKCENSKDVLLEMRADRAGAYYLGLKPVAGYTLELIDKNTLKLPIKLINYQ